MDGWVMLFFSSRRGHTSLQGDWSSDVCSSDLDSSQATETLAIELSLRDRSADEVIRLVEQQVRRWNVDRGFYKRSEERRVGKESRTRGSEYHKAKDEGKLRERAKSETAGPEAA